MYIIDVESLLILHTYIICLVTYLGEARMTPRPPANMSFPSWSATSTPTSVGLTHIYFPPTELEAIDHGVGVDLALVAELQPVGGIPLSRASPASGCGRWT